MKFRPTTADIFALALGFFATVSQVVLMREALGVAGGNELAVVMGFAAWFLGVGAGALLSVPLSRFRPTVIVGAFVSVPLNAFGVAFLRLHRSWLSLSIGTDPSLAVLTVTIVLGLAAGGLCTGFLFTAAARGMDARTHAPVSRLYAVEATGALIGGVAFALFFSSLLPHLASVALAGAFMMGAAAFFKPGRLQRRLGLALSALLFLLAIVGPVSSLDAQLLKRAYSTLRSGRIEAVQESPYGRLALVKNEDQHELLVDGRFHFAFPDPWDRPVPVHLALTQHPNPKKVLILGGGESDRLEAALAHNPDRVVMTYLNDRIPKMCAPFRQASTERALTDPRTELIAADGRRFITRTDERFDVVLVSAPPPLTAGGNRYHTVEFYDAVAKALRPGGVVTVTAPGGANVLASEAARAAASSVATVRRVFSETVIVPGIELLIHASNKKGTLSSDPEVLASRFKSRGVDSRAFSWRRFGSIFVPERLASVKEQLAEMPPVVNTDEKPTVYLANLQLWERSLGEKKQTETSTLTGRLESSAWIWFAAVLASALLGWLPYRGRTIRFRPAMVSIATTGGAGMSAAVLILYAFQASQGTLYVGIAVLTALYMAGLTAGAFFSRQYLASKPRHAGVKADGLIIVVLAVTGPVLSLSGASPVIPAVWSLVAGAATGAAFPVFLGLAVQSKGGDERSSAAAVEIADHAGAGLGALVTGIIWLPVFGVTQTCLMLAAVKGVSLVGQIWTGCGQTRGLPLRNHSKSL